MEENDGNMVRIRLSFDDRHLLRKSQLLQGLRNCWLLLKPDITNIGDLVSEISERFGLRHRIVLLMDDFVLPSFESTCLITDKDIIRVKKEKAKQKDSSKLSKDGKSQENLQGSGRCDNEILTSCMKNSIHIDPLGDVGSSKRKRKHSKKLLDSRCQSKEMNQDSQFEPENNSDVGKKMEHNNQMKCTQQQDKMQIEDLSLVDVRLVKASQDDHAMNDKWEEALLKGNWNEPNAFTTAQSNTWAPWNPNKSASTMSSFKQPNAPFAGRGTGRINLASNRSMNNRIPNMNTTNWNPNSNNAARNPNKSNIIFTAMYNTATLPWSYRASGLPNPRHKF